MGQTQGTTVSGHYEAKYPEAQSQIVHYVLVRNALQGLRDAIDSDKNTLNGINRLKTLCEDSNMGGDYYNVDYINHKSNWFDDLNNVKISEISRFLADLDTCITNANNELESWRNKSKEQIWVED